MIEVTEVLGNVNHKLKSKVKVSEIKQINTYSGSKEELKACSEIIQFDNVCYVVLESLQKIKEMINNDCDK